MSNLQENGKNAIVCISLNDFFFHSVLGEFCKISILFRLTCSFCYSHTTTKKPLNQNNNSFVVNPLTNGMYYNHMYHTQKNQFNYKVKSLNEKLDVRFTVTFFSSICVINLLYCFFLGCLFLL